MPLDAPANSLNLLVIKNIHRNTIILKNNSLVQVMMVSGTNFSLKPEEEQNILTAAYQRFLNSLGFPVQIIVHSRKVNVERYLLNLDKRIEQESSPLLHNQITEYREFVKSFVKENPIMTKSFFIAIPYHPIGLKMPSGGEEKKPATPHAGEKKGGSVLDFIPFFKKPAPKPEDVLPEEDKPVSDATEATPPPVLSAQEEAEFEKNLLQMKQRVVHVTQGLDGIGLQSKLLGDEELIELLYNFYNPETIERKELTLPK